MKFKCKRNAEDYKNFMNKYGEWHKYFCFFPKEIEDGKCAWFMYVERKSCINYHFYKNKWLDWKYRFKELK